MRVDPVGRKLFWGFWSFPRLCRAIFRQIQCKNFGSSGGVSTLEAVRASWNTSTLSCWRPLRTQSCAVELELCNQNEISQWDIPLNHFGIEEQPPPQHLIEFREEEFHSMGRCPQWKQWSDSYIVHDEHTYLPTYLPTYIHTYVHGPTWTYLDLHGPTWTYVYVYICIYIYIFYINTEYISIYFIHTHTFRERESTYTYIYISFQK